MMGGNVALMIPEMGLELEATVSSLWCSQFAFVRKGRTSFEYSCTRKGTQRTNPQG